MKKAWVVSVDMGYGHQRAAYPLKDIAYERIITANNDEVISNREKRQWHMFQRMYEGVSRFSAVPIIGTAIWRLYDSLQDIPPLYPFRDMSQPSFGTWYLDRMIKKGFVSGISTYCKKKELPFVSTFFASAIAAAHNNLETYCVVTDTDINRIWVPKDPKLKLYYLAPTEQSCKRLFEYGVPKENIFFTGFPLPEENIGQNLSILKKDLSHRLVNLDPKKVYFARYKKIISPMLGPCKKNHPLTLTYAVGGAGAQKEIGRDILRSLKQKIKDNEIHVNLIAGIRPEVQQYFIQCAEDEGLSNEIGKSINVQCSLDKPTYFSEFNEILHTTDILWTKPCELSFYTALGLPIIIATPIGAHEIYNQKWLETMGTGLLQDNPLYANEWLFDRLDRGLFAEAAWEGFLEAPKYGTRNIKRIIFNRKAKMEY